ncbi:MAG TPA: glycosyltransferase family 39 protein [Anaerolineales bacterium]|nr:glycosyltransferase family 39 protein [Anaerolineales bacterium]
MGDENQNPNQYPLGEPSVLDYVKSLLRFGNGERIRIPSVVKEEQPLAVSNQQSALSSQLVETDTNLLEEQPTAVSQQVLAPKVQAEKVQPEEFVYPQPETYQPSNVPTPFPWRSLLALLLALVGQRLFEPPPTTTPLGNAFYVGSLILLGWSIWRGEWTLPPLRPSSTGNDPQTYRLLPLVVSALLGIWAFISFNDNLFTIRNVIIWILSVISFIWAFWLSRSDLRSSVQNFASFFKRGTWTFNLSAWTVLLIAATALVLIFRFYQTASVPPEPFSDHAEKIFDVYDVSQGQTHIFFTRNTGREAFQMYWTLLVAKLFGTGLSFLSLKLGTAILGFLTLPFIYLLGKEVGGQRVGLFAFILVGIGYWPNVISRVGLRFPLYPLFVAPTLFFLIRGLRTRNRNDFLLSGLFLGLGLHGYSPFRIVPFVVIAAFVLFWLHDQSKGARKDALIWLTLLGFTSLFVFLPLLRYWVDNPAEFGFRAASRLSGIENPITQPIWQIFISNVWKALRMFNFDDGEIWVHSVTHRPALDVVSGALFVIGVVLVLVRYIRTRHWQDLFLLVSIPLLLLPSILSLAYPGENPALNRAGGAYIPAFLLGAMALDGLVSAIGFEKRRAFVAWGVMIILLLMSTRQNYDLVFRQYYESFRSGSWNTSDMGKVVKEFEQTFGRSDTVWIVPFPHWVDTRLPAVWAGIPNRDLAIWRENLPTTLELSGPKLFMVKANEDDPNGNDQETLDVLESLYPNGQLRMFDSDVPGHDFWIFTVPE